MSDMFTNELLVGGCSVSGKIKDEKFYMTGLNPSNMLMPPFKYAIEFDKKWLDKTIEELQAVREKL